MTTHYPDDAAIERLARGLIERSLPKSVWTHAAHFGAALWLLRAHGLSETTRRMPSIIRAYNEATATPNTDDSGYHETITLASLRAADALLAARPGAPLHEILDELMATTMGRPDWLLAHWSKAVLFSVAARRGWVEPDLAPFQP
ncbi:hypothetical protein [Phenylobacterium soli]|uniref:Uncharacterized protein n=1 Tax=Phenylobacterium soli TaxID=2170551 RepID=A0A328AHS9_9CAUL|nr:hypothetical protein [Phenylobacterium soli]RAK53626.1 hypothetical protein DJ017_03325 [Phenylobacterium soli]